MLLNKLYAITHSLTKKIFCCFSFDWCCAFIIHNEHIAMLLLLLLLNTRTHTLSVTTTTMFCFLLRLVHFFLWCSSSPFSCFFSFFVLLIFFYYFIRFIVCGCLQLYSRVTQLHKTIVATLFFPSSVSVYKDDPSNE